MKSVPVFLLLALACLGCRKTNVAGTPVINADSLRNASNEVASAFVVSTTEYDTASNLVTCITAINPDGTVRWKRSNMPGLTTSGFTYGDSMLFVPSSYFAATNSGPISYGGLSAVDMATGKDIWTYQDKSFVNSIPAISNGIVYSPQYGVLYGFDAHTGGLVWSMAISNLLPYTPTVDGTTLYTISASFSNAYYYMSAIDVPSKKVKWSTAIGYNPPSGIGISGNMISFVNGVGALMGIDKNDGSVKWTLANLQYKQHIVNGSIIYAVDGNPPLHLYTVDVQTGASLWKWDFGAVTSSSNGLYVYNQDLYAYSCGLSDFNFSAVKAVTGDSILEKPYRWTYNDNPVLCGNLVYAFRQKQFNYSAVKDNIMILDPQTFVPKDSIAIPPASFFLRVGIITKSGKMY